MDRKIARRNLRRSLMKFSFKLLISITITTTITDYSMTLHLLKTNNNIEGDKEDFFL